METKSILLTRLPLWECDCCGRLEFSEAVGPTCPKCEVKMDTVEKDSVLVFESIGQHFYRDTGFVRPGKDCRLHDQDERREAFERWDESGGAASPDDSGALARHVVERPKKIT